MSIFFKLPPELRDQIYELCLLYPKAIHPGYYFNFQRWHIAVKLFYVSKAVHREASSFFYSKNCFDLTRLEDVEASFLTAIGRNADYIRHVCIDFPWFRTLEPVNIALFDLSLSWVVKLQNSCPNLATITTSLSSSDYLEWKLDELGHPEVVDKALEMVDTHFRAISSLPKIIIQLWKKRAKEGIRRKMESRGWRIKTTEYVEEEAGFDMALPSGEDVSDDGSDDGGESRWR